jgi:uncharacterized protein YprB with RNaseH-like and TPR domain
MKLDRDSLDQVLRPPSARREPSLPLPDLRPAFFPRPMPSPPLELLVGGRAISTPYGDCLLVEHCYPLDEARGIARLGDLVCLPAETIPSHDQVTWLRTLSGLDRFDFASAVFLDIETTGLSGGAGTLAFLAGIGRFEGDHFVVRQFFMRTPAEERALLHAVVMALADSTMTVTFNGRVFDLPLLATRFRLACQPMPLANSPHLDVLTVARRLWRRRLGSCTLIHLEHEILGFHRTAEDIPSWLIPTLYQQYLRNGLAEPMARVFYHNREDVLSMAALTAMLYRACLTVEGIAALHPVDWVSLGQVLEAAGDWTRAERVYRQALARSLPDEIRRIAFVRLGWLMKRQERHQEAAALWEEWITSMPDSDVTPLLELAKYHEWHTRDIKAALAWSRWARYLVERWPLGLARDRALSDLDRRITRLLRKWGKAS